MADMVGSGSAHTTYCGVKNPSTIKAGKLFLVSKLRANWKCRTWHDYCCVKCRRKQEACQLPRGMNNAITNRKTPTSHPKTGQWQLNKGS